MTDRMNPNYAEISTSKTDTAALIEYVSETAEPVQVSHHAQPVQAFVWPNGETDGVDHRYLEEKPDRMRGTTIVHRLDHVLALVKQKHGDNVGPGTVTYADHKGRRITTVLNDEDSSGIGWADHRITYFCDRTPAWEAWLALDRALNDQEPFAEHIENRLGDIIQPDPADLLEIAQTMAASGTVEMRSARRLRDGRTKLNYHEDTNAVGGSDGQLEIPSTITLLLPLFHGTIATEITARFRYRFRNGNLTVGYLLNDPEAVERAAFAQLVDELTSAVPWTVIEAAAPNTQLDFL